MVAAQELSRNGNSCLLGSTGARVHPTPRPLPEAGRGSRHLLPLPSQGRGRGVRSPREGGPAVRRPATCSDSPLQQRGFIVNRPFWSRWCERLLSRTPAQRPARPRRVRLELERLETRDVPAFLSIPQTGLTATPGGTV